MRWLIDGYNLMHAAGFVGPAGGPTTLQQSRRALLNFVAAAAAAQNVKSATVVFDAAAAPPGLPREWSHRGVQVRFAAGYENADVLIEELIAAESTPRQLLVVSSDHQVQRAARRRRAATIDSDAWFRDMLQQHRQRGEEPAPTSADQRPAAPAAHEVAYWLERFAPDDETARQLAEDEIFPPGYGEDVLREDP